MVKSASGNSPRDQCALDRVRDTLERFRTGWEKQNAGQVLSTICEGDDTVIYGTDLAECWVGFDALVEPFEAMAEAIEAPVYAWGPGEPRIWVRGGIAWACGILTVSVTGEDEVQTTAMRATFVIEDRDGEWKIAHAHFSVGQEEAVLAYAVRGSRS